VRDAVGAGLSHFAYAPLLPEMVRAGWLSAGAAGVLGAANLAGYLGVGARNHRGSCSQTSPIPARIK